MLPGELGGFSTISSVQTGYTGKLGQLPATIFIIARPQGGEYGSTGENQSLFQTCDLSLRI